MKATAWEFANRAWLFGLIFGVSFQLYVVDRQNSTAALARWLGSVLQADADFVLRLLFDFAAVLLVVVALIRTWASAYLDSRIVYASQVKTESLVAAGPYRWVRNPLYFANVLLAMGMGVLMSRAGFLAALAMMVLFCYRLIFYEEAQLAGSRGEAYETYRKAVPRLWPSVWPQVASAGAKANWTAGFIGASWAWGVALAAIVFAFTLSVKLYLVILGASLAVLWMSSAAIQKRRDRREPPPR